MDKKPLIKKCLAFGIILLFVGVTIAPSINFNTVKASQDDDLVEVTTQACGIKGYRDTTVKLTREQYQDLEQYLVEFRARLNQTTTREEAVPIFKEAVVELNKYELLPKGMSVELTQKLVTGLYQNQNLIIHQKKLLHKHLSAQEDGSNIFCLIAGQTDHTTFENMGCVFINKIYMSTHRIMVFVFSTYLYKFLTVLCWINPLAMMNRINLGYIFGDYYGTYPVQALGWVTTIGLLGVKKFQGNMQGALPFEGTTWSIGAPGGHISKKYPATIGFIGIKIGNSSGDLLYGKNFTYIGSAPWTQISTTN
jgi:hypothetical protein